MSGLQASVRDENGVERLFAGYASRSTRTATRVQFGLVALRRCGQSTSERVITDFKERPDFGAPGGHDYPFKHGDKPYIYYADRLRIPASAEAFLDPAQYEQYSPYDAAAASHAPQAMPGRHPELSMASRSAPHFERSLESSKHCSEPGPRRARNRRGDRQSGDRRRRVGRVESVPQTLSPKFYQQAVRGASSFIGEIWHAEADTPLGPFVYSRKIITHNDYTFYNTLHHPELDRGQFIYVEGTYTKTYSGATTATPRYNYNQEMYRVRSRGSGAQSAGRCAMTWAARCQAISGRRRRCGAIHRACRRRF